MTNCPDAECAECDGPVLSPGIPDYKQRHLVDASGDTYCRQCWTAHWVHPCKSCLRHDPTAGRRASNAFGTCTKCEHYLYTPRVCDACNEARLETSWPSFDLQGSDGEPHYGWLCPPCAGMTPTGGCSVCKSEAEDEVEGEEDNEPYEDEDSEDEGEEEDGEDDQGSTAGSNRLRNLRDIAVLRNAYPSHCSHHLLYHHVMGRPGCDRAPATDDACVQGGQARSHAAPEDLADCELEALAY